MSAPLPSRLLVTRASGYIGRRTVELLLEAGAENVAASRYPEMLSDLASRGAEIRKADFDDPATLDLAFAGVERLLIVSTDAFGVPGKRQRQWFTSSGEGCAGYVTRDDVAAAAAAVLSSDVIHSCRVDVLGRKHYRRQRSLAL